MLNSDPKLTSGIFIGLLVGLHYHAALVSYLPILMIITVIMVLRLIHR